MKQRFQVAQCVFLLAHSIPQHFEDLGFVR
jgi:hypothetical protein